MYYILRREGSHENIKEAFEKRYQTSVIQSEILAYKIQGLPDARIATKTKISKSMVKKHLYDFRLKNAPRNVSHRSVPFWQFLQIKDLVE